MVVRAFSFFLLFLFSGCHATEGGGGSVVGNGVIRYESPVYGYSFLYSSALNLKEESQEKVALSGESSIKASASEDKLTFEVVDLRTSDLKEVMAYAFTLNPDKNWSDTTLGGAAGFFFEEWRGSTFYSQYVLRLSGIKVMVGTLEGAKEGSALPLLQEALRSFIADRTKPKILAAEFVPANAKSGDTVKFRVKATDNLSGVSPTSLYGSNTNYDWNSCSSLSPKGTKKRLFETCDSFQNAGDDWYELTFTLDRFAPPGLYSVPNFDLFDKAGNQLPAFEKEGVYVDLYEYKDDLETNSQSLLEVPFLTVTNPEITDEESPIIEAIGFDSENVEAGSKLTLQITAKDRLSGIKTFKSDKNCYTSLVRQGPEIDISPVGNPLTPFTLCSKSGLKKINDDSYEVEFLIPKHMPPGRYDVSLALQDKLNNESPTIKASVEITNSNEQDLEAPEIFNIKLMQNKIRSGQEGTLMIRARDSLSSISSRGGRGLPGHAQFGKILNSVTEEYATIPIPVSGMHHVVDDWYAIDFRIGPHTPPGRYLLSSLSFFDEVGNRIWLSGWWGVGSEAFYYKFEPKYKEEDVYQLTNIPVLYLEILP